MALSDATGDPSYGERSEGVIRMLLEASNRMTGPASGLFPLYLNPTTNAFTSHKVSFGAMGDSFYEYLLKMWLVGGRTEALAPYRRLWEAAMESLIAVLLHRSKPGGWAYITELCVMPLALTIPAHLTRCRVFFVQGPGDAGAQDGPPCVLCAGHAGAWRAG